VIGSPFDDTHGVGSGAAYLFRYNGNTWLEVQKLTASDGLPDDLFGEQVAIDGTLLIASAWAADGAGMDTGAAYLFRNTGTSWIEKSRIAPSDVADFDTFGKAVDVSGDTALAGSPQDDDLADRVGAGYFFSAEAIGCPDLYAEPAVLQIALGGTQYFTLRPPVGQAGDFYYLLGSASGTEPGFAFGTFLVPLNPDPYLMVTLLYPNLPPLATSFAPLSAAGQGAARFTLPPMFSPVLIGLTVSHAFGVFNAATLEFLYVSSASHLTFL
jgi:hypothetical protein